MNQYKKQQLRMFIQLNDFNKGQNDQFIILYGNFADSQECTFRNLSNFSQNNKINKSLCSLPY